MIPLFYSRKSLVDRSASLRRSDRKKTKKIFKDDFLLPSPFKTKNKKQKSQTHPHVLDSQIKKIQYLTEKSLATLNYSKNEFSLEMLSEMKNAVVQQQTKLGHCLEIKLIAEKIGFQNKLPSIKTKQIRNRDDKENTPKIQQSTTHGEFCFSNQIFKENFGLMTTEDLQFSNFKQSMSEEVEVSEFLSESGYEMDEAPKFRKESSKLLSDNYENNELLYTIDHMIPSWHKEENEFENPEEHDFMN